jgi:hypothetical protein
VRILIPWAGPQASVLVTIPVREGEQYRLKEIAWSGQSVIPYKELEKSMRLAPGSAVESVYFLPLGLADIPLLCCVF